MISIKPTLRILHLASSERWTGVAEPVVSLARQQQERGHQVWLGCIPGRSFYREARQRGLQVVDFFHLNRRLNPLHLISDLRLLRRFCREKQIDIVHCHLLHDHWTSAWAMKWLPFHGASPRLVRTIHSSSPVRNDWLHRQLFLRATDQLVCISSVAATATEEAFNLESGSIPWVGGAVDLNRFRPGLDGSAIRSELGIPADAVVAGVVSRMRSDRGFDVLMQSLPPVIARLQNVYVIVVGRGELKKWFNAEIEKPDYQGRVLYAGYRTSDLPQTYAAMDASLFLGLGSEGTCRAVLEAMACGRPTIGIRQAAVPEIIEDGKTGLLFAPGDSADLTRALLEMLADRDKCARMGREARLRAEERFTESARAESILEIYAGITRG